MVDTQRLLRRYERVAQREHFCDTCCRYISPGEYYEGLVEVINKKLIVFKHHINPSCDFPPDPDEDYEANQLEVLADNNPIPEAA